MLAVLAFPALPPLQLRERWSLPLETHSSAGTSVKTAVVGGRAFLVEESFRNPQVVACVDLATGRRVWRREAPVSTRGEIVASAGHLVVATANDLIELDPKTGRTLWQTRREQTAGGAVLSGHRLVYAPRDKTLAMVDLARRREVWRKAFPFRVNGGYGQAVADGSTVVFPSDDGSVMGVSAADGRTLWRRQAGQGGDLMLRTMGEATLVVGAGMTAVRTRDGKELWRRRDKPGWDAAYLPSLREVWALGMDGRLGRVSAATGRTLSLAPLPDNSGDGLDAAKPYGSAFLLATRGPLLRLDRSGRAVAAFDPQELVFDVFPLGSDVLLRTSERLVRLTPGRTPPAASLSELLARPVLTPAERRSVIARGRAAVPALIAAIPKATGTRRQALALLLSQTAAPGDSLMVLDLAERMGLFKGGQDAALGHVFRWIWEKGDREALADALLPRFKAAKTDEDRQVYLGLLARGTHDSVVDEMLARLRDPATPRGWKGAIYSSIGASGRKDVLETLLAIRAEGRRLEKPIEGLSTTRDRDGDGLPDAVDANPLVAPRALSDREKALAAAFDAFYRFGEMTDRVGLVRYGAGARPFELPGWKGGLFPESEAKGLSDELGRPFLKDRRHAVLEFRTHGGALPTVQGGPDGRTATVDLGVLYNGRTGWGVRVTLRKFGDEWFSVDVREAWIT